MKKVLLLFLVLMAFLLAGCGNGADDRDQPSGSGKGPSAPSATPSTNLKDPPDEAQIIRDLNAFGLDALEESGAKVTECEIVKRQSNTEKKEDIVFCKVTGEGDFTRMEYQFRLLYNFYDQGGWILDEVEPEKENEWALAYLDAEGNDILDDMIWLDGFTPEVLTGAAYYGTAGDTAYIGIRIQYYSDMDIWNIYDQKGNQVFPNGMIRSPEGSSCSLGSVYLSSDGKLRFSYIITNNGISTTYLIDEDGTVLNLDAPEGLSILGQSDPNLLIVRQKLIDKDNHNNTLGYLYGVMDFDGNIVVPIEHENRGDVDPDFVPSTSSADYQRIVVPDVLYRRGFIYTSLNGVFQQLPVDGKFDLVDAAGQPVVDVPYDKIKIDTRNSMIVVIREDTIQLYDLNGNVRSPEFLLLDTNELNYSITIASLYIVNYNGRCGILPQITTNEESRYFRYYWGSERFGSG